MGPKFCQYCGLPLDENCDCLRDIAEAKEQWLEDYYNSPETHAGWANQDLCEMRYRER